jgi:hypothetical protein
VNLPAPPFNDSLDLPDRFPYLSLPTYLRRRQLVGLAALLPWGIEQESSEDSQRKRSKTFVHFVKVYIASESPQLAHHLAREEAFVRLLSGVFYAVFLSIWLGFFVIGYLVLGRVWNFLAGASTGIFLFNIAVAIGILYAFHYQRLREIVMILSAYFLVGPSERSPYIEPPTIASPTSRNPITGSEEPP